jgi:hypothetical protein
MVHDLGENMEVFQMRQLLTSIQKLAAEGDCRAARDLASAGLTLLNGSDVEASKAWEDIESARLLHEAARTGNASLQ